MDPSIAERPSSPRTLTGKRPTDASLQRQHEYADWLQARPRCAPDASDVSWAAFMAERRAEKERARLQQVSERRRRERWRRRYGHSPPPAAEQRQTLEREFQAYLDARRRAVEKRGRKYIFHEPSLRLFFEEERRKAKERARLRKITDKRRVERRAAIAERFEEREQQRQQEQAAAAAASSQQARDAAARREECRAAARAVAAPLRRGERFCGHHHPDKYTGVRCAEMRKGGKGQCRVWSGSCYADAAPLRRGSPYCHHHRVRCSGVTRSGARCTVTSSSEHDHAQPLRAGAKYCVHHQTMQPDATAAEPPQEASAAPPPAAPAAPAPAPAAPITLAISSAFETPAGALPPSIFIAAKSVALQDYLERIRARFPHLQYVDLVCGDVVKSAWVLPLAAQTAQAGTLAAFMSSLGLSVEEADLDAESDAESDVDSVRCDTEDDELPPGVYRDADGTVHDLDDGSYGMVTLGSHDRPPPSPHRVIYDSDY
jgi:hypothetical protein